VLQIATISQSEGRFEITKSKHTMNLIFLWRRIFIAFC